MLGLQRRLDNLTDSSSTSWFFSLGRQRVSIPLLPHQIRYVFLPHIITIFPTGKALLAEAFSRFCSVLATKWQARPLHARLCINVTLSASDTWPAVHSPILSRRPSQAIYFLSCIILRAIFRCWCISNDSVCPVNDFDILLICPYSPIVIKRYSILASRWNAQKSSSRSVRSSAASTATTHPSPPTPSLQPGSPFSFFRPSSLVSTTRHGRIC